MHGRPAAGDQVNCYGLSPHQLNHHYATISTDAHYRAPPLKHTAVSAEDFITEEALFYMLDLLRPTAAGLDGMPAWLLRLLGLQCSQLL